MSTVHTQARDAEQRHEKAAGLSRDGRTVGRDAVARHPILAFLDRLVEAELLLKAAREKGDARSGAGQSRAWFVVALPRTFCAIPYIMISWFIAVRMLRFGRKFLLRSGHGQGGRKRRGLREPVAGSVSRRRYRS